MSGRKFLVAMSHGAPRAYGSVDEFAVHACGHARNRLLHACEAIALTRGLAQRWTRAYTPPFTLEGAAVQDATARRGEQAAHVLPGQLLIDGKPPWSLVTGDRAKAVWLARFMVTSAVPIAFNTADSAAEAAGLKEAFRQACERAWTRAAAGHSDLTATFEAFLADADRAFLNAAAAKSARGTAADAGGQTRTADDRFLEGVVLKLYRVHGVSAKEASRLVG